MSTTLRPVALPSPAAVSPAGAALDSRAVGTAFNESQYPVLDRHGVPFTPGCRVRFCWRRDWQLHTETGSLLSIDRYSGLTIEADTPQPVYYRQMLRRYDRNVYLAGATTYDRAQGVSIARVVSPAEVVEPWETYVEVIP